MDMRKWEILGIIGVVGVLLVLPAAVFGYQSYREAQEGPGLAGRPPSVFVPAGDPVAGRQAYLGKCAACHGQVGEGSAAGPDIRDMSVGAQFVYTWTLDPVGVTPIATMPKIPLTEKELADVTAYVMGLREGKNLAEVAPPRQESGPAAGAAASGEKALTTGGDVPKEKPSSSGGDATKGKGIYASKGCAACHGPGGEGTAAAPGLKGFPSDKVTDQVRTPKGKMPPFVPSQISDGEMEDLKAFLATLK